MKHNGRILEEEGAKDYVMLLLAFYVIGHMNVYI